MAAITHEPSYLALHRSGELARRGKRLRGLMAACGLCPRLCGARRLEGERGECGAGGEPEVAAWHPHFGEERPLVGDGGSGTVFLAHCSLGCLFCFNWEISRAAPGPPTKVADLAAIMLDLAARGCGNINVVTPTHDAAHVVLALDEAASRGLRLPLVWNTSGWERPEILRLLDGVVDVYLTDFKFADAELAAACADGAGSYPGTTRLALREMQRQVGTARQDADGLVRRGLMIRHLVMPGEPANTRAVIDWIAANLPADTRLTLMSQYVPAGAARGHPRLGRTLSRSEYADASRHARERGLTNLDLQRAPP